MEAKAREHERRMALSSGEEALKLAIAAADLYMQAMQKAKVASERTRLGRKCNDLIALAERLKANSLATAMTSRPPVPESTRQLSAAEKAIILRSSKLHGNVFPPWDSIPGEDVFTQAAPDGPVFTDAFPFTLSAEQRAIFAGWKRAVDLFTPDASVPPEGEKQDPELRLMATEKESDLSQDLATDCSVVASLCAALRYLSPQKGSLLPSLMYPFNHKTTRPAVSKNGKYIFRMHFNGCWRQVVIDDRLPESSADRTIFVVDKRKPGLIWPALVEKAYLKVRGGYDFPGSNSGTDLHALTGWIPEQIFLQDDDIELNDTWDRVKKAYDEGNAIVTLGTGNISPEEQEALGLAKEHDYAVLDLRVDDRGDRLLLVKNPWCDSLVWKGGPSTLVGTQPGSGSKQAPQGRDHENMTNTFWMTFEDVTQHFDSFYVNWNPAVFTHRQDHHFTWEMPDKTVERAFTHNPQYSVRSPSNSPVWILLNRHWQDAELEILRRRKRGQKTDEQEPNDNTSSNSNNNNNNNDTTLASVSKQLGFMSLALFATSPPGTRMLLPDGHRCVLQGPYVDSPNTLLRIDSPTPNQAYTLVVAQGALPLPRYSFTLSFFSTAPLSVEHAPEALPHHAVVTGAWTRRNAGGSAAHASYATNPQYALTVPRPTPLSVLLSTDVPDLPVHVAVLYSAAASASPATLSSLTSVTTERAGVGVVASSPEYQRGCTSAVMTTAAGGPGGPGGTVVEPGVYTIVASTFEPGQLGRFTLRVAASASSPVTLRPVLPDAAGRFRVEPGGGGGGPAVFGDGEERLRASVRVARLTRACVVAQSIRLSSTSQPYADDSNPLPALPSAAIRVALELGTGPRRVVVAVSRGGEFADAALGLRTPEVDLEPDRVRAAGGELWLVVEQLGAQRWMGSGVRVEVLCDSPVSVGEWECADDD